MEINFYYENRIVMEEIAKKHNLIYRGHNIRGSNDISQNVEFVLFTTDNRIEYYVRLDKDNGSFDVSYRFIGWYADNVDIEVIKSYLNNDKLIPNFVEDVKAKFNLSFE